MEELYTVIRRMTSDSRMISLNTDFPQYKINQLKSDLFLRSNKPNKAICEWWLRLYRGEYTESDIKQLQANIDKL